MLLCGGFKPTANWKPPNIQTEKLTFFVAVLRFEAFEYIHLPPAIYLEMGLFVCHWHLRILTKNLGKRQYFWA